MSTYWGYHCQTDGASSPHYYNHGEDWLDAILKLWPHIQAIREAEQIGTVWIKVTTRDALDDPFEWLDEHGDHALELENEYGAYRALPLDAEKEPSRGV